jgi:ribosomal protein L11 methyltransferase
MKWVELSVEVHPEAVDAVAEVFHAHGTGGVSIDQPIEVDREGELLPTFVGQPVVKAYLPMGSELATKEREIEEALWHLQAFDLSPVGPLNRREMDEEDWANGWKEHFHPLRVGRIVIKPTWREWESGPDELVVELDPGMAFGTGLHPTTQLMLSALQARVRPDMRILDLGTGSGILAIPAAMLGARVTGLDTSEVAVEVACENFVANGVTERASVARGSIDRVAGQRFELVFANIIASVLVELAPQLAAVLEPAAELLGSGIIDERADEVRDAFVRAGLEITDEQSQGDWWLIVARAPA